MTIHFVRNCKMNKSPLIHFVRFEGIQNTFNWNFQGEWNFCLRSAFFSFFLVPIFQQDTKVLSKNASPKKYNISDLFMQTRLLKTTNPGWKPIAVHRWSPMNHRSPTGGPLRWRPQFLRWSPFCSIGGHRWKLIITSLANDGSTGNKSVKIPKWYPSSVILGLIPSKYMVLDLILSGKSL